MRAMSPILLVTLALGVVLVGTLAILQRGTVSGDRQDCQASSSVMVATPAAPAAATPAGTDSLDRVLVNTGLVVVAEPDAIRLIHSVVIQLPALAPQVAVLLGSPPWSNEYEKALTSLLQPTEVKLPGSERKVLPGVSPFADPNGIIARMTAVPLVRIDGNTATIVPPLREDRIAGSPPAQQDHREPWLIKTIGRDLVLTFNQDTTGAGEASRWTRTWQVEICAPGLQFVSIAPLPTAADGAGRVVWTLSDVGRAQETIEVRLRPEPEMALRLWLFAGARQYLSQAWSFMTPVLLLLVAYLMVPRVLPASPAAMLARQQLQLIALVSLGLAMTGLFALGLLAFRSRMQITSGFGVMSLGLFAMAAVGLAIWGWMGRPPAPRRRGNMTSLWFYVVRVPKLFTGPVFNWRRLRLIVFSEVVVLRQFARFLHAHLLLLPGTLLVLSLVWWLSIVWLVDQSWFVARFDLPMIDANQTNRLYALARLYAAAAFTSILAGAIGIGWPSPERGASRWLGLLVYGTVGIVLCTPLWSWTAGLIPLWTVSGFLIASVLLLSTFLLAPVGKSLVARCSSAWAIGLSLIIGGSLAVAAAMWGWAEGLIPERWIGGFLLGAVAAAVMLAAVTLRKTQAPRQGDSMPWLELVTTTVVGAVLLMITGILAQWARSTYNGVALETRLELDADPEKSISTWYEVTLRGQFLNFPLNFIDPATDLLLLAGIAGIASVLRAAAADQHSFSSWMPSLMIFLYAALVVGYGGEALGYHLPLAFLLALLLLRLVVRLPGATVEHRSNAPREICVQETVIADEGREDTLAKLDKGGKDTPATIASTPAPSGPDLPLDVGPRGTWWNNGVWAFQRGACLAILPVGYFVYVLIQDQLDFLLSGNNPFGAIALITGLAYELAFWLTAAFALGALYPCLWGTFGPLKGAVLAAVYTGSHAAAALLLGEAANDLWEVRSFQLLLFLAVLGIWFDYSTLGGQGNSWGTLKNRYHIDGGRTWIGYLSPLVVTVAVVIQQLYSGETSDAVNQIITVLTGQFFSFPFP